MSKNVQYHIRMMKPDDIEMVFDLRILQQQEVYDVNAVSSSFKKQTIDFLMFDLSAKTFVAIVDNVVVGMISYSVQHNLPQVDDNGIYGYISNLYVSPGFRCCGIATALLENCFNLCKYVESCSFVYAITEIKDAKQLFVKQGMSLQSDCYYYMRL